MSRGNTFTLTHLLLTGQAHLMSGKEAASTASKVSTASTASTAGKAGTASTASTASLQRASLQLSLTEAALENNDQPTPEAWVGAAHLGVSSAHLAGTLDTQTYAKATDGTLKARAMAILLPAAKIVPTSGLLIRSSGPGSSYRVG